MHEEERGGSMFAIIRKRHIIAAAAVVLVLAMLPLGMRGFRAGAVGCSAALIFGYLASLIFRPRMKK